MLKPFKLLGREGRGEERVGGAPYQTTEETEETEEEQHNVTLVATLQFTPLRMAVAAEGGSILILHTT